MGFNKVYKSLQEIFPQIDARALRAVAIEHIKDADAAAEAVLVEIIPFFTERSTPNTLSTGSTAVGESSAGAIATAQTADCTSVNAAAGSTDSQNGYIVNVGYLKKIESANDGLSEPLYDTSNGHCEGEGVMAELTMPEKDRVNAFQIEVSVEPKTDKAISDGEYPESNIQLASDNDPCQTSGTLKGEDAGSDKTMNILRERADSSYLEIEFDTATNEDSDQGKTSVDGNTCAVGPSSFVAHDLTASLSENNLPLVQKLDVSLPNNTASKMEFTSSIVDTDDESTLNGSMSQSSKTHMIDALTKIIADARNNKKMLFMGMESVISLMREVELKEKAAEQAKAQAAMSGTDILIKSEELKQMLKQAEEANSMHAGDVYGEKAILATELRELQSRALSVSVARDKYLAVLDEMQQILKVRLAEAQNVIKSAEQEKIEKEKAAMESLTEQELIMETVLQESKNLNQQADDNAKLREFLVDRGHVVDTLQGEISVICQDVRLLKEKFDEHIPFSKSLSSSQTSFMLASSGSSSKSLIPEQVDPMDTREEKGSGSCSTEHSSQDEAARDDRKALSDEEWEICDGDISS